MPPRAVPGMAGPRPPHQHRLSPVLSQTAARWGSGAATCDFSHLHNPHQLPRSPLLSRRSLWDKKECDKASDDAGGTICSLTSCCCHLTIFFYQILENQGNHVGSSFQGSPSTGEWFLLGTPGPRAINSHPFPMSKVLGVI